MGSVVKFSAINSKTKALKGKMLSKEEYLKLFQCKDFISAIKILKEETSYGEILKQYEINKIHRGDLEVILDKHYIKIYDKIISYFNGECRKLMKCLFLRWEIEDLKLIIRGKYVNRDKEFIEKGLVAKSTLNTIDYDYLLSSKTIEELTDRLKGSIYYSHIKNLSKDITEKGLFRIETELDFVYFITLRKQLKRLDKENREVVQNIIGIEADLLNLSWIYRGKKFYSISPEELFNYTIYDGYKLSKEKIKALCYANNMEEFYSVLEKTPYSFIYKDFDSNIIEKREREFQKNYFNKILREGKMNLGVVISYLIIYKIEVRDIISIVEEKRYDMDIDEGINYVSVTL